MIRARADQLLSERDHASPVAAQVVYLGRRPKRLSHRRLISLQVDVVGHVLVNGLNDRRRRILADGIQDVSERRPGLRDPASRSARGYRTYIITTKRMTPVNC